MTITDQLSAYVEFVDENGRTIAEQQAKDLTAVNIALKVTKTVDGEVDTIDADDYTVSINAETKTVSVNFD